MKKWAALALAGWCWAGAVAADEALDAWRAAVPAKLDALQTVREKAEFRMEMAIGGMKNQQVMELEFVFRRPDALVAKGPFAEVYVLGTNATTYQKMMQNEYRRETAPDGLFAYMADFQAEMLMLQADKQLLLRTNADERVEILDELLGEAGARRLPDEELDGRTCEVLVTQMDSMFKTSWVKIWFDAETGLLRRIESVPTPEWAPAKEAAGEDEPEMARALRDVKIVCAVREQQVNEPIPDEAFAFVPPEGAKEDVVTPEEEQAEEIADANRAIQKAAGLERFELSGQPAPDFELPLLAGGTFKLSAQTGKVVVIDFWATWCGPCVRALPEMKKLAEAYAGNPDVAVVGFSTDEEKNRSQVEKLVAKNQLPYPIGLGPADAKTAFKVSGIPCIVVVGKDGVVQGRRVGFSPKLEKDLKRAVAALLADETLESAAPYTAEELKALEDGVCPKCGKRHGACSSRSGETKMDPGVFKLRWSRAVQAGEAPRSVSMGMERFAVAIPPRTFLRLDGAKAVAVDAASGEIAQTLELPADMCATNEQGEIPDLVLVRTPEGDAIVGYQEYYAVTKKGTSTSYRNRKTELFGRRLPDGEPWRKELGENDSLRGLHVVPISATADLLVAATWNDLRFLDTTGATVLKQALDYRTQATFALDAAGKPVLYLVGPKIELYDVVWPPEAKPAEPAAPAAEPPAAE